jgi:hypothetical protein
LRQRHAAVPVFWSQHYDLSIRYVGHAERWDLIELEGSIAERNCVSRFSRGGRVLAVAALGHDREALRIEAEMEKQASAGGGGFTESLIMECDWKCSFARPCSQNAPAEDLRRAGSTVIYRSEVAASDFVLDLVKELLCTLDKGHHVVLGWPRLFAEAVLSDVIRGEIAIVGQSLKQHA